MLFFLVSFFFSLLLFFLTNPVPLLLPSWANELRLLFVLLSQEFLYHSIQWFKNYRLVSAKILKFSFTIMLTNRKKDLRVYNVREKDEEVKETKEAGITVLDLPELALELILEKLSTDGLLNMASVCTSLRERCRSNYLWERHFREKWGRIIGQSAQREWESYSSSSSSSSSSLNKDHQRNGFVRSSRRFSWLVESLSSVWPFNSLLQYKQESGGVEVKRHLDVDSVMAWYLALESGRFRFPAQVYNREQKGHVGFMMSCYDAELSYDSRTDTFHARYAPHGQRVASLEEGVEWDRLRPPPMDTLAHDLHISDCLNDLHPGDHIEIQWRRNKDFPYGWWYGVVGHLESCDGDERHCHCYNSDTVIVEFNQYSLGSRWRRTVVNRKDHREEGNESQGFYGGIRKLYNKHEISMWNQLWPTEQLE